MHDFTTLCRWLDFWNQIWFSSCWLGLNSNWRAFGYCQGICATIAPLGYYVILFIIVHRYHSWLGLLVALLDAWHYWLASWNLVLREKAFISVPAQVPLGPTSEVYGILSNRLLSSPSVINQEHLAIAFNVFEVSWAVLNNNSKVVFSCLVLEDFVRWPLALEESVISPYKNFSFKLYMHIYIQTYGFYRFFRQIVINMLPCDFFRHLYYYFNFLFPSYVFLSPCLTS